MTDQIRYYLTSPALGEPVIDLRVDEVGNVAVAYTNDPRAVVTMLRLIADDMEQEATDDRHRHCILNWTCSCTCKKDRKSRD